MFSNTFFSNRPHRKYACVKKFKLVVLALLCTLPTFLRAQNAEQEEATRIQIQTGASLRDGELRIFTSDEDKKQPRISTWLESKAEYINKSGRKLLSITSGKDWSGARITANAEIKGIAMNDTQIFQNISLVLRFKSTGKVKPEAIQVALSGTGSDGKMTQSNFLPLKRIVQYHDDSWCIAIIELSKFSNLDRLRDLNGLSVQFMGKAPAGSIVIDKIAFEYKSKSSGRTVKIEEVQINDLELTKEMFPPSATNIRIKGPDIMRDGKPVFLTGVEDDAIIFPWLYRLMKFDVIQLQDLSPEQIMKWDITAEKVEISWKPLNDWFETKIRTLLNNGLAIHVNYWDFLPRNQKFKDAFDAHIATSSHFYSWRLDDPTGRQVKENFTRATLKTLGKYPITFYELYNELYYGDTSPAALRAFQMAMQKKYTNIAAANKVWSTSFPAFAAITPPWKTVNWSATKLYMRPQPVPIELYVEWQRFVEEHLGRELQLLTDNIKKDLKYPYSYIIYQAVMNLHQDYSGMTNTYPRELMKAGDALCQEGGMYFYPQHQGTENIVDMAKTTRSLMIWDLLADISPDKPVYLSECGIGAYPPAFNPASVVVNLNGTWRFADDSAGKGESTGYSKTDFNDNSWTNINAPGVWGAQGFPKCTKGWYRRNFTITETQKKGKLFLTGKELADRARIYLNGQLIHETEAWNAEFSLDMGGLLRQGNNTIALEIFNQFEAEGQIQGGIRNLLAITDKQFFKAQKLTAGQMRSWFWGMAVHNVSGVIMSYFYTPATNLNVGSIYNPTKKEYAAIRAIPEVKNEIESVAKILLPRPRLKPEIAFVYPFESGRARIAKDHTDLYTGPMTLALMNYYLSALFSQLTPTVTSNDSIINGDVDKFKVIIMPVSPRVQEGTTDALERYVRNGGVLILGPSALSFNDCTHRPISTPDWFGIKTGKNITTPQWLNSSNLALKRAKATWCTLSSSFGIEMTLDGAKALAEFDNGSPAISVHKHGEGYVYYFACNLPFIELKSALSVIFSRHGLESRIKLRSTDGDSADYIESHIIGNNDCFIFYLNNFGGGERQLEVSIPEVSHGAFKVSDIRSGKVLHERLSAGEIKNGLKLTSPSQDPVTWLFEKHNDGEMLKLSRLTPDHQRFLNIWNTSPRGKDKILFHSLNRAALDPFRMLTGKKLLEDHNFEIDYALDLPGKAGQGKIKTYHNEVDVSSLSDYNIYVLAAPRLRDADAIKAVSDYVKNGGSLLLSATANVGYFGWMSNQHWRKPIFEAFGLGCSHVNFKDEQMNDGFSPSNCMFANITPDHPVTRGVTKVQLTGASVISATRPDQQVLIRSNATSTPATAPFMVAMKFGKGRIVAMGDPLWMQPEWLDKEDNAQLMLNIFNWLANRDTQIIPREELRSSVASEF